MTEQVDPFGRTTRKGPRLTDQETTDRMLKTGVAMVHARGLQLSFDLLSLEEVIEAAEVSRSAVYRRWPTKAYFFADLLRELAGATHPASAAYSDATLMLSIGVALEALEALRTPAGRRLAVVEMCRLGGLKNFETISSSQEWHTYIALQATLLGLPNELKLQEDLAASLRRSEEAFIARMTRFYSVMADTLGFRLRNVSESLNFSSLATLGAAVVEGLAINSIPIPEVGQQRFVGDPFSTGNRAEWSLPAFGFTSIVLNLIEPDQPEEEWSDQQIEQVRGALMHLRGAFDHNPGAL